MLPVLLTLLHLFYNLTKKIVPSASFLLQDTHTDTQQKPQHTHRLSQSESLSQQTPEIITHRITTTFLHPIVPNKIKSYLLRANVSRA